MKIFLLFLWQLPQNLLGFIISLFIFKRRLTNEDIANKFVIKEVNWNIELTLGRYLIIGKNRPELALKHNIYGHGEQSVKYGPLYLLIVGLPAIILYSLTVWGTLDPSRYHTSWPEIEANDIANIYINDRDGFISKDGLIMPL